MWQRPVYVRDLQWNEHRHVRVHLWGWIHRLSLQHKYHILFLQFLCAKVFLNHLLTVPKHFILKTSGKLNLYGSSTDCCFQRKKLHVWPRVWIFQTWPSAIRILAWTATVSMELINSRARATLVGQAPFVMTVGVPSVFYKIQGIIFTMITQFSLWT